MTVIRMLAGCCLIACLARPVAAQVNNPAYADYLLVGRFGEICTMCEAVVLCAPGESPAPAAIPDDGSFTLYHLETRTFWSQIATIREWFIANFTTDALATGGHARPVRIITVTAGAWRNPATAEARLTLEPGVIEIADRSIDRVDRRWLHEGEPVGYCRRLPLWSSLAAIENHAGATEP